MAFYRVTLKVLLGDYEKYITTVQEADGAEQAEYMALRGETHNASLSFKEWCEGVEWWDDYMLYDVYSTKNISEQTYKEMI